MDTNNLSGIGCYKRMKAHIIEHVEATRGTMFRAAARKAESALNCTLDEVESEFETKVWNIVELINKDYSALLVDQNIFKALSTSRDEVGNLLAQVDGRFDAVLRSQLLVQSASVKREETVAMDIDQATVKREETAAMDIDQATPAVPPSLMPSAFGTATPAAASTRMAADSSERLKTEASSTAAPGDDVPMRDA